MWWTIVTGVLWLGWVVTYIFAGGYCDRPDLVENFSSEKYLGRWYEIYRSKNVPFEEDDCATATYIELPWNYIEVNNIEWSIEKQINVDGVPDPGKAQYSSFRSGLV